MFCDGDFWHGRDWSNRKRLLKQGSNADYWVRKIEANRERDRMQTRVLEGLGWTVLRFWEADIKEDPEGVADEVQFVVLKRGEPR